MTLPRSQRSVLAVLAVTALLVLPAAPALADDAADAFRAACQGCHANPARVARRNPGATAASRAERWDTMLRAHHAPDPVQRALVIEFLERSR